jgi:nitroimidazol reductase NimA-like FMN-containing flavoprotein (pyridoxamine 5'-phosphate oxidase superfamily)
VSKQFDRNGLEILSRAECLQLLAGARVGRVGLSVGALPAVLPVNFAIVDDAIVLRTAAGSKLDAALANAVVAFEVDSIDPLYHTGWSVLVQGVASEVVDPAERERLRAAPLRPWADGDRDRFVRIYIDLVSGRRLVQPPLSQGTA